MKENWVVGAEFNAPPDTVYVISEQPVCLGNCEWQWAITELDKVTNKIQQQDK